MAAVVRIKRRLDEDPLETLVLNCKRRKTNAAADHTEDDNLSAVLKLAGTSQKGENIESLLRRQRPEDITELKEQFKKHTVNINEKLRSEARESSKNSRYRVVNCFRKTLNNEESNENLAASTSASEVTVLDIETDHNEEPTSSKENSDDPSKYVYDFYYTSSDDFGQANIEEYVSLYPLNDPLVFGSVRDNGLNEEDSEYDSEDSNAENNWKNDYPDEENLNSGDEDDLMFAVNKLNLEELSSDSEEEDLVYGPDEEDFQHEVQDVDREDELRYGKMYAKFKAKNKNVVTTGLANDLYVGDIDEDEYYY